MIETKRFDYPERKLKSGRLFLLGMKFSTIAMAKGLLGIMAKNILFI